MSWAETIPKELERIPKRLVALYGLKGEENVEHKKVLQLFKDISETFQQNYVDWSDRKDWKLSPEKKKQYDERMTRGILKTKWMRKYLDEIPSVILLFFDLDWDESDFSDRLKNCKKIYDDLVELLSNRKIEIVVTLLQRRQHIISDDDDDPYSERQRQFKESINVNTILNVPMDALNKCIRIVHEEIVPLSTEFYWNKIRKIKSHKDFLNDVTHKLLIARHSFKLAFFYEIQGKLAYAFDNYLATDAQLMNRAPHHRSNTLEIKTIIGFCRYKMMLLNMRRNIVNPFNANRELFDKTMLIYREHIGYSQLLFEHLSWMGKYYSLFADLHNTQTDRQENDETFISNQHLLQLTTKFVNMKHSYKSDDLSSNLSNCHSIAFYYFYSAVLLHRRLRSVSSIQLDNSFDESVKNFHESNQKMINEFLQRNMNRLKIRVNDEWNELNILEKLFRSSEFYGHRPWRRVQYTQNVNDGHEEKAIECLIHLEKMEEKTIKKKIINLLWKCCVELKSTTFAHFALMIHLRLSFHYMEYGEFKLSLKHLMVIRESLCRFNSRQFTRIYLKKLLNNSINSYNIKFTLISLLSATSFLMNDNENERRFFELSLFHFLQFGWSGFITKSTNPERLANENEMEKWRNVGNVRELKIPSKLLISPFLDVYIHIPKKTHQNDEEIVIELKFISFLKLNIEIDSIKLILTENSGKYLKNSMEEKLENFKLIHGEVEMVEMKLMPIECNLGRCLEVEEIELKFFMVNEDGEKSRDFINFLISKEDFGHRNLNQFLHWSSPIQSSIDQQIIFNKNQLDIPFRRWLNEKERQILMKSTEIRNLNRKTKILSSDKSIDLQMKIDNRLILISNEIYSFDVGVTNESSSAIDDLHITYELLVKENDDNKLTTMENIPIVALFHLDKNFYKNEDEELEEYNNVRWMTDNRLIRFEHKRKLKTFDGDLESLRKIVDGREELRELIENDDFQLTNEHMKQLDMTTNLNDINSDTSSLIDDIDMENYFLDNNSFDEEIDDNLNDSINIDNESVNEKKNRSFEIDEDKRNISVRSLNSDEILKFRVVIQSPKSISSSQLIFKLNYTIPISSKDGQFLFNANAHSTRLIIIETREPLQISHCLNEPLTPVISSIPMNDVEQVQSKKKMIIDDEKNSIEKIVHFSLPSQKKNETNLHPSINNNNNNNTNDDDDDENDENDQDISMRDLSENSSKDDSSKSSSRMKVKQLLNRKVVTSPESTVDSNLIDQKNKEDNLSNEISNRLIDANHPILVHSQFQLNIDESLEIVKIDFDRPIQMHRLPSRNPLSNIQLSSTQPLYQISYEVVPLTKSWSQSSMVEEKVKMFIDVRRKYSNVKVPLRIESNLPKIQRWYECPIRINVRHLPTILKLNGSYSFSFEFINESSINTINLTYRISYEDFSFCVFDGKTSGLLSIPSGRSTILPMTICPHVLGSHHFPNIYFSGPFQQQLTIYFNKQIRKRIFIVVK
ncbi:hypothetical protein SNEBB_008329 [Seison nebaliae]|nr:hypothetical protein SNEBB_008329 [Seison nebaliae]